MIPNVSNYASWVGTSLCARACLCVCAFVLARVTTLTCVCVRVPNRPDGHAHPYCGPCLLTMAETEMDSVHLTPTTPPQVIARGVGCWVKDACAEFPSHTAVSRRRLSACRFSAAHNATGRKVGACKRFAEDGKVSSCHSRIQNLSLRVILSCAVHCGVLSLTWLHFYKLW